MPIMSIYSMIAKYICNFPKRIMEMCITGYLMELWVTMFAGRGKAALCFSILNYLVSYKIFHFYKNHFAHQPRIHFLAKPTLLTIHFRKHCVKVIEYPPFEKILYELSYLINNAGGTSRNIYGVFLARTSPERGAVSL